MGRSDGAERDGLKEEGREGEESGSGRGRERRAEGTEGGCVGGEGKGWRF